MPKYLLEIGTEELPADHIPEAQERLKILMSDALKAANLSFGQVTTMGTPRRLACMVDNLAAVQETVTKKIKGPQVKSSFDAAGKPLPPALKFAASHGLTVEDLAQEDIGSNTYLIACPTIAGKPARAVLGEIVPQIITRLSGERLMRWGSGDLKFSRPIRWLVSLLDTDVLPLQLDGLASGRHSCGNRVLAGKVAIQNPDEYVEVLRRAFVLVDPAERRTLIERQVSQAAAACGGRPRRLTGPLLEEVINITEWPFAVLGEFAQEYLVLPEALIETVMVHHQRYFPVEEAHAGNQAGKLLPYFITVANNDRPAALPAIKQGNERVIRARLADGRFFYLDDQKTPLGEREQALDQLTFQHGLGSYLEKTERLAGASRVLAESLNLPGDLSADVERACRLCKLDLVTNLVKELPELQGYVGSWYAEKQGESPVVVQALSSHYAPRSQQDTIPADTAGRFVALVDKLDNLVGLFALGRRPSGSSDPYALQRQAQGVVDILIDGLPDCRINVSGLIEFLMSLIGKWTARKKGFDEPAAIASLREFLLSRVRIKLQEMGFCREIVEAVLAAFDPLADLSDVLMRCRALQNTLDQPGGLDLMRAGVRIGNILTPDSPPSLDPARLHHQAECKLWEVFQQEVTGAWETSGRFAQPETVEQYAHLLSLLSRLVPSVDTFFEQVLVNDPDQAVRDSRHALLNNIYRYFHAIADFPRLQPLLP